MITPITLTRLNEQSDTVANLHVALKALGLGVAANEVAERRAGAGTLRNVRAFQQERGIRFDEKLLVDGPTAAAMNELLTERGLLSLAPAVVEAKREFTVKGTITTTNGYSVRDLVVFAFDQDLRSRQELGSARAGAKGEYSISYGAAQFARAEKGSADLVVEVRSPRGETLHVTNILFNAPAVAKVNIALDGSWDESEFERIKLEVERLIDGKGVSVAVLEEDGKFKDVTFIGGETGVEKGKIAHFIVAHKLAGRGGGLDPEFWYASLEGRVFSGALAAANGLSTLEETAQRVVAAVASTKIESVEAALNTSLADKVIDARFEKSVAAWLKKFHAFAAEQALKPAGSGSPSALKQLLDFAGLAEARQTKFAQHYVESGSERVEVIKRLRRDKSFSPAEVRDIEKTFMLNDLTFGSVALVRMLGDNVKDADAVRELAKTRREDWEALLLRGSRGKTIAAPDFVAGTSPEEKAGNYAALLTERFQSEYPTAAFAGGLERAMRNREAVALKHADKLVEFLNSHPAFELHATAVEGYVEKNARAREFNAKESAGLTQELKAAQRVFKLAPSFEATNTLLTDDIHSAQQVYRMGETKFVRQYANRPGFSEAAARTAFQRAANTQAAVVTVVTQLASTQNANAVWALSNNSAALSKFPNLQNLFGTADICECEHCRSVYSPAAYFADMLMFLQARDSVTPGVSVKEVLFRRRPDIGFLELSCENSNTPLPYVDLACEVLEDRVKAWHLFDLPLTLAPSLVKGAVSAVVQSAFAGAAPTVSLSDEANISERFAAGYWVIRDPAETYQVLEVGPTSGQFPLPARLSVSVLRQTHNTAEELLANPEYVNEAAYVELRGAKYPSALPFDLFTEELRAYLGKVSIKRADLMEVFLGSQPPNNPTPPDIAAEYFGIAKDEQPIILQADIASQFVYWGEASNADVITNIGRVDVFLRKTGLEYNDLLKLLSLKFINPTGGIRVVHLDSSCDTSQKIIQVLDAGSFDRIHRFLRLWRKLGWEMWEVDLVIGNSLIGNNVINSSFIRRLKPFAELKAKFPALTVEQLCSFFDELNTTPKFTESYKRPELSLYERLFLNKPSGDPVDAAFEIAAVTAAAPTETLGAHVPPILAALKVREADFALFGKLKRPSNGPDYLPDDRLSLSNLSMLYRHAQLARLLKFKASEWQTLLYLAQLDPFKSTQAALDFVETVERVRASRFSIDELGYLLSADLAVKPAPPEKNVTIFLAKLRAELKKIAAEYETSALPADEQALTTVLAALLQKLNRLPEIVAAVVALVSDENVRTIHLKKPLPQNFAFPASITQDVKIVFDSANNNLTFTGVMTNAIRNRLLTDTNIDPLVLAYGGYQAAVNLFYNEPRVFIEKEMKFFRAPVFSAPLTALPGEINFAAQLPKALRDKVFFDGEQRLLQFAGEMASAEKAALLSLSLSPTDPVNVAYVAAVNALDTLSHAPTSTFFAAKDLWITTPDIDELFDNPTIPVAGPDDHVVNNLKTVVTKLYDYLRPLLSEDATIQLFGENLGVSPAIARKLLKTFSLFGTPTAHPLIEDYTDASFVASTDALTGPAHADRRVGYYWLHRVALVVKKMKVSFTDLEWIILHHAQTGVLYFKSLPTVYNSMIPAVASLDAFLDLSDYMQTHQRHSGAAVSLLGIVSRVITDASYGNVAFSKDVELLTGWNAADIKHLTGTGVLNVSYPAAYQKILNWKRLAKAVAMAGKLNGSAQSLTAFAAASVGQAESVAVKQMLRSKYEPAQWLDISREIQDELRQRKRDSLVAYLLTRPMPADAPTKKWENANDLYAYYLIDVEMCSCQLTSRLVQASAAIQLFVQRCFMGLEPEVRVSVEEDDAWEQWKWMKSYRVWEANRKVFLYPENWIAPELRRDKSQFFKDLENELLQNEVNRDNVEMAFLNYVEKLDGVAQLEIAGTFYQEENRTLHVFARTPGGEPHTYYYRQWVDDRRWTFWSKVDCDIKGDYLIPIIMEGRLYLVWPEFREEPVEVDTVDVPSAGTTSFQVQKPLKSTRVYLAISEYRNKKWSPKKVSKDFIDAGQHQGQTLDKSRYLFLPLDFTDLPGGKFLIYFEDRFPNRTDATQPPRQIFELLGCKGYPERSADSFNFRPVLTRFDRDEIRYLRNSEETQRAAEALVPYDSYHLRSTIFEKTPDNFKISYPHYLSYFDRLLMGFAAAFQFGPVKQPIRLTLGTFYNWFYADKSRTFFVRPQLARGERDALFYKELEAFVKDTLELIQAGKENEAYEKVRRFYQSDYQFRLLFRNFYHPFTCLFARELYNRGVDGLMSRETQFADNKLNFRSVYGPTPVVNTSYPQEVVDFAPDGSYSQYNWELFFHAPLMIAMRLSKNQRFEEAMQWFHYIFDPTGAHARDPVTGAPAPAPQRYWNTKPFYQTTSQNYVDQRIDNILKMLADDPSNPTDPAVKQELVRQVADSRANPFDPHLIAQFRTVAYQKTTVMKYIDNLIAWGDQLFRRDTMESVGEAAQLYVQAAEILGPRPRKVPPPQKPAVESFNELEGRLDAFSNAVVNFENLIPVMSGNTSSGASGQPLPSLLYFCIPQNDQLLSYWDTVADRLYKIRHCLNIEGVFRQLSLFAPPIDPGALVRAVAAGVDISSALGDLNAPLPHYRFNVMLQKANEVTGDVRALGGALLSALEKKDAEALSLLRQSHELKVLEAVKAIKEQQIDDAKLSLEGLQKSREVITARRDHYQNIERINASENLHQEKLQQAFVAQQVAQAINVAASIAHLIPNIDAGVSGFGGSPQATIVYGGLNFGSCLQSVAGGFSMWANAESYHANKASINAGHERRWDEWKLQERLANKELAQIDKQIASAELKISIAEKELQNHELQIENSKAVDEFMRGKYTSEELYDWMVGQISQVYFQSYQLAYDLAKRAEKCFQYELGVENTSYVQFGYWDSLRKGLLAGEKLQYDLRRLDAAYVEQNRREFELTKHVSLALTNPTALLQLRENGWCFFELPEELFDLDYQGHYFRRIKTVSISIPCVAGPHTTVNGTLRLIKSSVRINTHSGDQYEHNIQDGVFIDDARFREGLANVKAIATSSAQNDSGVFDLNFRDERYLPFEGAGAISTWKLELTAEKDLRLFDYDSISDVVAHMRYTAREDAGVFKQEAVAHLQQIITAEASQLPLRRLFNLKHEFPTQWYAFLHPASGTARQMTLPLKQEHFPFFAQEKVIKISAVSLFVKGQPASSPTDFRVQLDPLVPPTPAIEFTLASTQSFGKQLYWLSEKELDLPIDETNPWLLRIRKSPDGFDDLTEVDVEDCFVVVEYSLQGA